MDKTLINDADIHKLKLHEVVTLLDSDGSRGNIKVMRVVNGWIYHLPINGIDDGWNHVFVPFDNKFMKEE